MAPILGSFGATSIFKILAAAQISPPTYTFTSVPASINEGASGNFTVTTTKVGNGTTLYWTINNVSSSDSDFVATSGSFTINNNSGTFSIDIANDSQTEGTEAFTVSIRENSISGTVLATSQSVNIGDRAYTFVTAPTSINEGVATTYVISTTNVAQGNTLYWTINHISTAPADFTATSGSFNIAANSNGSFVITTIADVLQEGSETFTIYIRVGGTSGTIVSESSTITINDTSLPAAPSSVQYLFVGAGGGGGTQRAGTVNGGGGGGGGYRTSPALTVGAGVTYTIQVGGGASGGTNGTNTGIFATAPFAAVWSNGGGYGGGNQAPSPLGDGASGGSGGGGGGRPTGGGPKPGGARTVGHGNNGGAGSNGGYRGGGGGGSGGAGAAAIWPNPAPTVGAGNGGLGTFSTISGANTGYSGGGGGAGQPGGLGGSGIGGRGSFPPGPTPAGNGLTNQGGGGGGGDAGAGGSGGSGVAIIKYPASNRDGTTTGSPEYSNTGGFKVYKFNGSGSISW